MTYATTLSTHSPVALALADQLARVEAMTAALTACIPDAVVRSSGRNVFLRTGLSGMQVTHPAGTSSFVLRAGPEHWMLETPAGDVLARSTEPAALAARILAVVLADTLRPH